MDQESDAGKAYSDSIDRLLGEQLPLRFVTEQKKGFLKRIFGS